MKDKPIMDNPMKIFAHLSKPGLLPRHLLMMVSFLFLLIACSGQKETQSTKADSENSQTKTRVIMLGVIHSRHLESTKYSIPFLTRTIQEIDPDFIITEIPPDRFDKAVETFAQTGQVEEPRVKRFPEYTQVVFPLTTSMKFEIIPAAAWTQPMAEYRQSALNKLARDETRANDWKTYTAALDAMNDKLKNVEDDPFYIHTDEYDEIIKQGLTPYAELFANDLGRGDWTQINKDHYALISAGLDKMSGQGKTALITYGAGHKYWFLEQLKKRKDITLVSPLPYLEIAKAAQ